jgi:hypothetical protein
MLIEIDEIALRIFCAMLTSNGHVSTSGRLGEEQIKTAFELARTFIYFRTYGLGSID